MKTHCNSTRLCTLLVSALALSGGCVSSPDEPSDDGADDGPDEDPYAEIRSCVGDATNEEIANELAITGAYEVSLHEVVVCGNLTHRLTLAIAGELAEAIFAGAEGSVPDGWSFEDDGSYRTEGPGVVMTLRLFSGADYDVAAAGEPILDNVFVVDNYFVGARTEVDLPSASTRLVYDDVGPLVELLGLGATPPNPPPLTLSTSNEFGAALRSLGLQITIELQDGQHGGTIRYEVQSAHMSIGELLDGGELTFDLRMADGAREDTAQTLQVVDWDLAFTSGGSLVGDGGSLIGTSDFEIRGGLFDFDGIVFFDDSTVGETRLRCP